MPFLSLLKGITATNPYLTSPTCRAHVILTHPSEVNSLILTTGDGAAPYSRNSEGHLKIEDRSITGSPKFQGANYLKDSATCNFLLSSVMLQQFERLLVIQRSSIPITVVDQWDPSRYKTFNGVISIGDSKWKTHKGPGWAYLVQFTIEEL
jgi:hypothetical protein